VYATANSFVCPSVTLRYLCQNESSTQMDAVFTFD